MQLRAFAGATLAIVVASSAIGATLEINATANNGSRFIEHVQDAFWELGQTRASSRVPFPDGAFNYASLPNYVPQGGGGTAFPNKQNFQDLGAIEYDSSTGAVTGLTFNFSPHVAPGRFTFYQAIASASPYATSFGAFSGSVTLNGAAAPTINLTSEIKFTIESAVDDALVYTGVFNVVNNVFTLAVDDTAFSPLYQLYAGNGNIRYEWAVTGTLAAAAPAPPAGDFNLDGLVDGADFLAWQRNPSVGSLDDWKANYGAGASSASAATPVPEPAAMLLIATALISIRPLRISRDTQPRSRS
ncbi:hypothetical protein [Lacipirellula sp.]|uniref:hypothetical protein n=1 Tax=Lacipirellula sp. TaxID=2691419 RepID=UPI003D0E822D